jgi:hypothetical protein
VLGQSIIVAGACGRGTSHLIVDRRQKVKDRKGPVTRYLQKPSPSDLLHPATLHLLKFPELPKIAPPPGDKDLNTYEPVGAHFIFKPTLSFFCSKITFL